MWLDRKIDRSHTHTHTATHTHKHKQSERKGKKKTPVYKKNYNIQLFKSILQKCVHN